MKLSVLFSIGINFFNLFAIPVILIAFYLPISLLLLVAVCVTYLIYAFFTLVFIIPFLLKELKDVR